MAEAERVEVAELAAALAKGLDPELAERVMRQVRPAVEFQDDMMGLWAEVLAWATARTILEPEADRHDIWFDAYAEWDL